MTSPRLLTPFFLVTVVLTVALTGALAAPSRAQTSLPDETTVVATTDGLFVVMPHDAGTTNLDPVALQVATPADFGISAFMNMPSVAWIDYSNVVMVSTSTKLFRVVLTSAGQVASIQFLASGSFTDIEYSAGLDTLFVLDAVGGVVHALFDPRTAAGTALTVWNDKLTPGDGLDIAINTKRWPFSLIVLAQSGFLRLRENNLVPKLEWNNPGFWSAIDLNPRQGDLYVLSPTVLFGFAAINLLNDTVTGAFASNTCSVPATAGFEPFPSPQDIVSDGRRSDAGMPGVVVVSNDVNPISCFNAASGVNHVGRFPVYWPLGNPQNEVRLFTPTPVSGISGSQADLDYVRVESRGITHQDWAQWTVDHVYRPEMEPHVGTELDIGLLGAPPSQLAALSIHVLVPGMATPIDSLTPLNADSLVLYQTSPLGQLPLEVPLPSDPILTGMRAVVRWYVADPSTVPGEPSFVTTQRVIYHHGAP